MNLSSWYKDRQKHRQQSRRTRELWSALSSKGLRWTGPLTPIREALEGGSSPDAKAPADVVEFLERVATKGWRPLHRAVHMDDVPLVVFLLERGANPSLRSDEDETPAMFAASNWNIEMTLRLLDAQLERQPCIPAAELDAIDTALAQSRNNLLWLEKRRRYVAHATALALADELPLASVKARPRF